MKPARHPRIRAVMVEHLQRQLAEARQENDILRRALAMADALINDLRSKTKCQKQRN